VILTCIDTATGSLVSPTYSFGGTQDSIPPSEPITPQPQPQPQPHRAVKPNLRPENRSLCTGVVAGGAGYLLTNEAKEAAALRGFSLYGRILTGAEFGAIEGGGLFSLEGLVGGAAVGGVTYVLDRWSGNTGAEALTRDQGLCR